MKFDAGKDWLIYAVPRPDGPGLMTSECLRTRLLKYAGEDLEYARTILADRSSRGKIYGRVDRGDIGGKDYVPLVGVRVTATSVWGGVSTAVTDRDGRYEIAAHEGDFRVHAEVRPDLRENTLTVRLADNRACAVANLSTYSVGSITGRVLTASGKPVPNIAVELVPTMDNQQPRDRMRALTDASGRYVLAEVKNGYYRPAVAIGVTQTQYGPAPLYAFASRSIGDDRPVELQQVFQTIAADLILPKSASVTEIAGVVVDTHHRRAAIAKVHVRVDTDATAFPYTSVFTNARGEFAIAVAAGTRYRVTASTADIGMPGRLIATTTLNALPGAAPLRLVLK